MQNCMPNAMPRIPRGRLPVECSGPLHPWGGHDAHPRLTALTSGSQMLTAFFAIFYASFGIAQASYLGRVAHCAATSPEHPNRAVMLFLSRSWLPSPLRPEQPFPPQFNSTRQAQTAFPDLAKAAGACQRVFRILDSRPSTGHTVTLPDPSADPEAAPGVKPGKASVGVMPQQAAEGSAVAPAGAGAEVEIEGRVELRRVAFAYPTRPQRLVLKEFNLTVPAGTSCALVSGAGQVDGRMAAGASAVQAMLSAGQVCSAPCSPSLPLGG